MKLGKLHVLYIAHECIPFLNNCVIETPLIWEYNFIKDSVLSTFNRLVTGDSNQSSLGATEVTLTCCQA